MLNMEDCFSLKGEQQNEVVVIEFEVASFPGAVGFVTQSSLQMTLFFSKFSLLFHNKF